MWDASDIGISLERRFRCTQLGDCSHRPALGLYGFCHFCFDRLALVNFPFLKTHPLTTTPKVLSRLGEFGFMNDRRKKLKTWRIQTHCQQKILSFEMANSLINIKSPFQRLANEGNYK